MPGTRSGIGKIQASLNGLSPKLRSIAEHILKHPQDVVHKSITVLAKAQSTDP
ncbi:MurR/RpiR family transcriptional regulator, partial [Bacillus sp. HC-Mk]